MHNFQAEAGGGTAVLSAEPSPHLLALRFVWQHGGADALADLKELAKRQWERLTEDPNELLGRLMLAEPDCGAVLIAVGPADHDAPRAGSPVFVLTHDSQGRVQVDNLSPDGSTSIPEGPDYWMLPLPETEREPVISPEATLEAMFAVSASAVTWSVAPDPSKVTLPEPREDGTAEVTTVAVSHSVVLPARPDSGPQTAASAEASRARTGRAPANGHNRHVPAARTSNGAVR